MKNYKREEKDAVCRALQTRTLAGKAHHQVMIRNQPAKVHRILRYLQNSAAQIDARGWDCPSASMDDDEIEVRTPDSGRLLKDQPSLRNSGRELLRRLSMTPGIGRPILTHDDLGKAELLCLEGVRYFETLLSSESCARPKPGTARYNARIWTCSKLYTASALAHSGRYNDARLLLNRAFDELKYSLHEQSPMLLLAILDLRFRLYNDKQTPFKVLDLTSTQRTCLRSVWVLNIP
jgi:hypothetical protein